MKKSLSDGHKWLVNASVRTVIFFLGRGGVRGSKFLILNQHKTWHTMSLDGFPKALELTANYCLGS